MLTIKHPNERKCMSSITRFILMISCHLIAISRIIYADPKNKPTTGIQRDGSCPLVVMIPFSDRRNGPPDWVLQIREYDTYVKSINSDELIQINADNLYGFGWWPTPETLAKVAYGWLAAAQLAVEHFNTRDPSIVPLLSTDEIKTCDIQFPNVTYLDSSYSKSLSFERIIEASETIPICAVIGPDEPEAALSVALVTDYIDVPQLSYGTLDERISDRSIAPSVARPMTEIHMFIESSMKYLQRPGKRRDYVALVHDLMQYGEQVEHTIFEVLDDIGLALTHHHIRHGDKESVAEAIEFCAEDGYRTFMIATDQSNFLENVAEAADKLGLINDDYFWVIVDLTLPNDYLRSLRTEPDSPFDKMLRGAAIFRMLEPFEYKDDDKFLNNWRGQSDDFVQRLNVLHPLAQKLDHPGHFTAEDGFFQENDPPALSSFIYDSVMLTGISACRAHSETIFIQEEDTEKNPHHHLEKLLQVEMEGASGSIKFEDGENSRLYEGIAFGVYNVWPGGIEDGKVWYNTTLTSIDEGNGWYDVEGTQFKFFSGQTSQPKPLRTVFEENFLPLGMQIVGLIMMSMAIIIVAGSTMWVWRHREQRCVKASQPQFLYLLNFGGMVVAISQIFISFDESYGWSEQELSNACITFPWFFVIGILIQYCAIYCKFYRINMVFSTVRRKVTVTSVMLPFIVIIAISIIILVIWTIIDPLQWQRVVLIDYPLETYGRCSSNYAIAFILPLCLLVGITILLTLYVAWQVKDLSNDFAEWNWVFYGVFTHSQILAIGVPLFIILKDISKSAMHIVSTFFIFIFSITLAVLVIWPKAYKSMPPSRRASSITSIRNARASISLQQGKHHISGVTRNSGSVSGVTRLSGSVLDGVYDV